jgi:acyl carrier protein
MSYISEIRKFVIENFLFGEEEDLKNDAPFFETGIVDSTGMLEIVTYLEETFKITVKDEEVVPENFSSIHTINQYIQKKLNGKAE